MSFHRPPQWLLWTFRGLGLYLALMCDGYFLLSVFTDPGFVPLEILEETGHGMEQDPKEGTEQRDGSLSQVLLETGLANEEATPGTRFCGPCRTIKPIGAHHCSVCKRCVDGMDHHCPFTSNCVGRKNRHFFLWAGFFGCVGCFFAMLLSWLPFQSCIWHVTDRLTPETIAGCSRLEHEALLFIVAAIGFVSGLTFAMWHLWNAATGVTTITRYQRVFRRAVEGVTPGSLPSSYAMLLNIWNAFGLNRVPLWHVFILYPLLVDRKRLLPQGSSARERYR